jgi:muconate cycloisomerase
MPQRAQETLDRAESGPRDHLPRVDGVAIRGIEVIPLRIPFKSPYKIATADNAGRPHFDVVIVRLRSDAGVEGIGETQAWRRQGSTEDVLNLTRSIREYFAPLVVGRSPFDIAPIMSDLDKVLYQALYAQAAIGDALYDLCARLLGIPAYQLLGGKCRDRAKLVAVLPLQTDVGELRALARWYYERGFRHFEVKIGLDSTADLRNVEAMRETFGDAVCLRVDANAALSYDAALSLVRRLAPLGVDIVEQPLPIWDLEGMAALAARSEIPIMADESVSTMQSLLEIIRRRAATSIQTKIGKNGGIYHIRRLWPLAEAAGIGIMPGNHPITSVAAAATAHLCAAWSGRLIEGCFAENMAGEQADEIVCNPPVIEGGECVIPAGPGFGMVLDEAKIKRYRLDA